MSYVILYLSGDRGRADSLRAAGGAGPGGPLYKPKGCLAVERYKKGEVTLSQEGIQPEGWALQDVSNYSFVFYQDLSEYIGF